MEKRDGGCGIRGCFTELEKGGSGVSVDIANWITEGRFVVTKGRDWR